MKNEETGPDRRDLTAISLGGEAAHLCGCVGEDGAPACLIPVPGEEGLGVGEDDLEARSRWVGRRRRTRSDEARGC